MAPPNPNIQRASQVQNRAEPHRTTGIQQWLNIFIRYRTVMTKSPGAFICAKFDKLCEILKFNSSVSAWSRDEMSVLDTAPSKFRSPSKSGDHSIARPKRAQVESIASPKSGSNRR